MIRFRADRSHGLCGHVSTTRLPSVRTLTVEQAQAQLGELIAEANRGGIIVLSDGEQQVTLLPGRALDLEEDSPELESELLVAINGPYTPYSSDEMRAVVERIIREEERK